MTTSLIKTGNSHLKMIEPRNHPRNKALKDALVIRRDLQLIIECTLRNASNEGALIDLESNIAIPHDFELLVKANRQIARCELVWRKNNKIGVRTKSSWQDFTSFSWTNEEREVNCLTNASAASDL